MNKKNLLALEAKSLRIYEGMKFSRFNEEDSLCGITEMSKFPGTYNANNSTTVFVEPNGIVYVSPFNIVSALEEEGFTRNYNLFVPFSNYDFPVTEMFDWKKLVQKGQEDRSASFEEQCIKHASCNGIKSLAEDILSNCLKIPETGIPFEKDGYRDIIFPEIHERFFGTNVSRLIGTYNTNNGVTVFINTNGDTYLGVGRLHNILEENGFRRNKNLFVPLSNWEQVQHYALNEKWKSLKKF